MIIKIETRKGRSESGVGPDGKFFFRQINAEVEDVEVELLDFTNISRDPGSRDGNWETRYAVSHDGRYFASDRHTSKARITLSVGVGTGDSIRDGADLTEMVERSWSAWTPINWRPEKKWN